MSILRKKIKNLTRDFIRFILGVRVYTLFRFLCVHRYYPNFKTPSSFSEKIIARKFDDKSIAFSKYVDKYLVRDFVRQRIGDEFVIPVIKRVKKLLPKDFDDLPDSFVIKTSNGGGGENVLIVDDKSLIDIESVCKKFNSYLNVKIGQAIDEYFYDIETPTIIIENLIKHADGRYPSDYKLHVFSNELTQNVFIQVDVDRFNNHRRSIYNESLEMQDFNIQPKYEPVGGNYEFPYNMKLLIDLAKKLATDFKYVRVDMYNVDGAIYFGEMTFCHGSGWEPISSRSADLMLGSLWKEYN